MHHLFLVTGAASADLPLRILNLFAQQDLVCDQVTIMRDGDRYRLSVEHHGLPAEKASIIANKLAAMVLVDSVEMKTSTGARSVV